MSVTDILGSPTLIPKVYIEKLQTLKHIVIESIHRTKAGELIPVEVSATLFILNGLPTIQAICRDITKRTQAERTLRASQERLILANQVGKIGTCEWDLETGKLTWSEEMEALFNLAPGSFEGSYEHWLKRVHPDDRASADAAAQRTVNEGIDFNTEFRILLPDGNVRWVVAKAQIFNDSSGKPYRLIGVNMDITDRKKVEAEREQLLEREKIAREQAEAANRVKDEFLAVLSHELRTPLNPILGWTRLLQAGKLDQQKTALALATIERNTKLQTQLIEDLLDISRILQGKLTLNIFSVDLAMTIEAAKETVRLAAEAKLIEIRTDLKSAICVMGDVNRLQQVVWNLLSNAVKFTPAGGLIDVKLESIGNYAQITVKDTGKGINADFLPYVFEYFRQADSSITRKFGGLGLGLAIAQQIVELHGGTIKVESLGEGLGASFTVRLPLIVASTQIKQNHKELNHNLNLQNKQILIVDDEADTRELIAFVLQEYGATIITAASAKEALTLLQEFSLDLLISDIGMPEMDGYSLMRQVRSLNLNQQIPAIALTAYASEEDQKLATLSGFQVHIAKPLELKQLSQAIVSLIS